MIQLVILVSDVNYRSIAKLIGGFKGWVADVRLALCSMKNQRKLVIDTVKNIESFIIKAMNKFMDKIGVPITLNALEVSDAAKSGMELEFCFSFGNIDRVANEEFVSGIISRYAEKIIEALNKYLKKKGWKLTLAGLEVKRKKE